MKLRQKLAAVLATAMVVTSIPVVATAAATNTITRPATVVGVGESYNDASTSPILKVRFDGFAGASGSEELFYLTLKDAKWNDDVETKLNDYGTDKFTVERLSDTVLRVEAEDEDRAGKDTLSIPMLITVKGDKPSVEITKEGSNSNVIEGTVNVIAKSDEVAQASVAKVTSINKEGKIGTIVLTEAYAGSMKCDTGYNHALIELENADYEFDFSNPEGSNYSYDKTRNEFLTSGTGTYTKYTIDAKYTYGFVGATGVPAGDVVVFVSEDRDHLYVQIDNDMESKSKGKIELNSLAVKSTVKNPAEGEIKVSISGDVEELRDQTVAINGSYNATITTKEVAKILAGQKKTVNFTIKETVDGTFTNGRAIEVKADNGYFMDAKVENDKVNESETLRLFRQSIKTLKHNDVDKKGDAATIITGVEIEDEKVVGFTFKLAGIQTEDKIDEVSFGLELSAGIEEKGEVKLTAESRDFQEAISGVVAEIRSAVEVTAEAVTLKTGLMNQEGGKITVKESEAGVLSRSEQFLVYLPSVKGISIQTAKDKLPEVKVTEGDAQIGDVKIVSVDKKGCTEKVQALQVTVKRESKAASTIEISNFHIDTDRTVAEGAYNVEIGGKALTSHADETIKLADFIKIGTANTEDLVGANGLAKGTSVFVIGENKYTLNGVEKMMDAQSFIQDPGYTMIPVRYVAEAFGVEGNNVLFSKGVVTLFAGNRTIQLTVGSDIATVNGAQVQLSTKVAVKEGRTYAPVGEIARILGVSCEWDNTTKTATFINK